MTQFLRSTSLQRKLSALADEYDRKVASLIADVRRKNVVPFCDRHHLQFGAGNGEWAFMQVGQPTVLNEVPTFPGSDALNALLHTRIDSKNDAGSLMAGYVGKNYDRQHPALEKRQGLKPRKGARPRAVA